MSDSQVLWELLQALTEVREPWLDYDPLKERKPGEVDLRYYLGSAEFHVRRALNAAKKVEKSEDE